MTGRSIRTAVLFLPFALVLALGRPVLAVAACGDGTLDEMEQCDDGNTAPGDCCDPSCAFESADTICRAAASICDVAETCTGASDQCPADVVAPAGTACRAATGICDQAETCTGDSNECPVDVLKSAGTPCRVAASTCDFTETCTGLSDACPADVTKPAGSFDAGCDACESCNGAGACAIGPVIGCKVPTEGSRSKLALKNRIDDAGDVVEWKWLKGQETVPADYGDPVTTTSYRLCLFDLSNPTPAIYLQAAAPAAGNCTSKPCWKGLGKTPGVKGYRYNDKEQTPDGLKLMVLSPGIDGNAKIILKGKDENLGLPIAQSPVPLPIRVQLQASNGTCFEATYSTAEDNDGETFKAGSD